MNPWHDITPVYTSSELDASLGLSYDHALLGTAVAAPNCILDLAGDGACHAQDGWGECKGEETRDTPANGSSREPCAPDACEREEGCAPAGAIRISPAHGAVPRIPIQVRLGRAWVRLDEAPELGAVVAGVHVGQPNT